MEPKTLSLWKKLESKLCGKWAFSKMICRKAPYFGSIKPLFDELRPEYCKIHIKKRRPVLNHIGTVHAIAMCNMAEVAGGIMTEVTVPPTHRWIPIGMTVQYLKKAESNLSAVATPAAALDLSTAGEYVVKADVMDKNGTVVFTANITMWVSPKK